MKRPLIVLLALALAPVRAFANFIDNGAGARAMGMGHAYTAVSDDINAVHYNPAGLAGLTRPELLVSHSKLLVGLQDDSNIAANYVAYAHPVEGKGVFTAAYNDTTLEEFYRERTIRLGYAREMSKTLRLGATLKILNKSFGIGGDPNLAVDPLFKKQGTDAQAMSLDLGARWQRSKRWSFGASVLDANSPDTGLGQADKVERTLRAGVGYHPRLYHFGFDLARTGSDLDVQVGGERWFARKTFALRGGFGLGSRSDRDLNVGATYRNDTFEVNYAMNLPLTGISGTSGTHRFSFIVRFGARAGEWDTEWDPAPAAAAGEPKMDPLLQRLEREERERYQRKAQPSKPAKQERAKVYTVQKGDNLKSIAQKLYGDPSKWVEIYHANQDRIGVGGVLTIGQVLIIP